MAPLILFSILFICGLINSYFFPPSKLLLWVLSLLSLPFSPNPQEIKAAPKKENTKKEEGIAVANAADLKFVFSTFDSDGDGFITAGELEESLRKLGLFTTKSEVLKMVGRIDANGDGLIDLPEFRELYDSIERRERVDSRGEEEEEGEEEGEDMDLRDAFNVFDGNRDGLITVEELGLVLKSLGLKQGEKANDCREMISKVDLDGDGMVNFEEFKMMMMVKDGKLF